MAETEGWGRWRGDETTKKGTERVEAERSENKHKGIRAVRIRSIEETERDENGSEARSFGTKPLWRI